MIDVRQILPQPTNRAVFVGQTGSGKTTLAREMLKSRRFVVVLDPKGLIQWDGYRRYTTLDGCITGARDVDRTPRVVYAPVYEELQDPETMDTFFRWVYERRNCTVYVDEIYAITKGDVYPWHLGACLTRGRERKVETWCATQRPARVPQIIFSEAEDVYCFRLRMPQDRERVEDMTGIAVEDIAALPKRRFIYAPQDGAITRPMELHLAG